MHINVSKFLRVSSVFERQAQGQYDLIFPSFLYTFYFLKYNGVIEGLDNTYKKTRETKTLAVHFRNAYSKLSINLCCVHLGIVALYFYAPAMATPRYSTERRQ